MRGKSRRCLDRRRWRRWHSEDLERHPWLRGSHADAARQSHCCGIRPCLTDRGVRRCQRQCVSRASRRHRSRATHSDRRRPGRRARRAVSSLPRVVLNRDCPTRVRYRLSQLRLREGPSPERVNAREPTSQMASLLGPATTREKQMTAQATGSSRTFRVFRQFDVQGPYEGTQPKPPRGPEPPVLAPCSPAAPTTTLGPRRGPRAPCRPRRCPATGTRGSVARLPRGRRGEAPHRPTSARTSGVANRAAARRRSIQNPATDGYAVHLEGLVLTVIDGSSTVVPLGGSRSDYSTPPPLIFRAASRHTMPMRTSFSGLVEGLLTGSFASQVP